MPIQFDQETLKKIQQARQYGYSDKEVLAKATAYQASKGQQTQSQGFNPLDLLPLAGALGGSFIGNPILGGALGAGVGTFAKQGLKNEPVNVGEAGGEAALAGVGGVAGAGLGKLLGKFFPKLLGGATKGVTAGEEALGTGVGDVANATRLPASMLAEEAGPLSKILTKLGRGVSREGTIPGTSTLNRASQQEALQELTSKYPKYFLGSGTRKFNNAEKFIADQSKLVDETLKGVPTTIPARRLGDEATKYFESLEGADKLAFKKIYDRAVRDAFGNRKPSDLSGLDINAFTRVLNKEATRAYNAEARGVPLSSVDRAIVDLRDISTDLLTEVAPPAERLRVQDLNKEISTIIKGIPDFKRLSEEGLTILGTRIPLLSKGVNRSVQALSDYSGQGIQALGGPRTPASDALSRLGLTLGVDQGDQGDQGEALTKSFEPTEATPIEDQGSQLNKALGLLALSKAKSASDIKTAFELLSAGKGGALSADDRKRVGQLNRAEIIIDNFANLLGEIGSPEFAPAARLRGLGVSIGGPLGLAPAKLLAFRRARSGLRVQLARQFGEVGNLSQPEQQRALELIPDIGESADEVALKVAQLKAVISNIRDTYYEDGSSSKKQ